VSLLPLDRQTYLMSHASDDKEASLAFARNLQAEYDPLAHAASSQQESSIQADSPMADQPVLINAHRGSIASSTGWRNGKNKEQDPRKAEPGENSIYTPPMSDEEFARLLQMQEERDYFSLNGSASNVSTPAFAYPGDFHGKNLPPLSSAFRAPPSPPISPSQIRPSSAQYPSQLLFQNNLQNPSSSSFLPPPTPPRWIEEFDPNHSIHNGPPIHDTTDVDQPFQLPIRTHSPTVSRTKTALTDRIMMKLWQNYYKRNTV
jgi:hypothetical protein